MENFTTLRVTLPVILASISRQFGIVFRVEHTMYTHTSDFASLFPKPKPNPL